MILRMLNFMVIGALVLAAAYVYRIKFDSTVQAEHLAKLRSEVRHERDRIAALRAEWGELDNPARIEALAKRYPEAQANRSYTIRHARSAARAAAGLFQGRQQGSDWRHDREFGGARRGDGKRPGARRRRAPSRKFEPKRRHKRRRQIPWQLDLRQFRRTSPGRRANERDRRSLAGSVRASPGGGSCAACSMARNIDRGAKARARVGLAILAFAAVYAIIAVRLVMFGVVSDSRIVHRVVAGDAIATARPDILDRNGEVLATDVRVPSLYGEPRRIIDVDEAVELLTADLPDLDATELRERLSSKRGFVWLKRDITPDQQREIYRQGLPGIGFLNENKRTYPNGPEVSHLIGHVNIDNQGIAGMEKWLDTHGLADLHMAGLATDRLQNPVQLAVDLRVQHALRDELVAARAKFKALAAAGLVLDVRTGEVVAMVSEPDYDPNNPREALDPTRINRLTTGVYEMGSTFKAFTIAMALDSGKVTLKSSFDARMPLHFGRFDIHDFDAQHRVLTVPEIFTYSSNIGAARIGARGGRRRA